MDWETVNDFHEAWDAPNRKPGCLPRVSKPGEWCPMAAERIKVIPRNEWSDILSDPDHMQLWPSVWTVLDQDGEGSCATESTTGGVMVARSFAGQANVLLNPWFIYYHTRVGMGGSNIDSNLAFARKSGIAPMDIWPRSKGVRKPSDEAYEAALQFKIEEFYDIQTIDEFGTALLLGWPVVYGRRGHSILGIDLVNESDFRMLNSWGSWGDRGTSIEAFRGINWGYGAFAIRTATSETVEPFVKRKVSEMPPMFEPYPVISEAT